MKHLISTNDFTNKEIDVIFDDATYFDSHGTYDILKDKLAITLFFENSTRTRSSFEIAAKRLGASVVNLDVGSSSSSKGETLIDTVANLNAMRPDVIIIRHKECGLPESLITHVNCPIINAGDGTNEHPTQALLDLFTIKNHYQGKIKNKKIAIIGDIKTSRVASSNLQLLPRFGIIPILVAPNHFMPNSNFQKVNLLKDIIDDIDIIMSLRTQLERHDKLFYNSIEEYGKRYCLTTNTIGKRDVLILHPGPVNRNIDISDELLLDKRCKVLDQVYNGVLVRMSILKKLVLENSKD